MKKFFAAILAVATLGLAGCDEMEIQEPDQELRASLFKQCMELLPAGPTTTMYNDWDEVVGACGRQAYYQSLR